MKRSHGFTSFGVAAVVGVATCLSIGTARADIFIGLQEVGVNGGAVTEVDTGSTSASFSGTYGNFSPVIVSGENLASPGLLESNALITTSSPPVGATLNVFVTRTGLTGPIPLPQIISGFTSNFQSPPPAGTAALVTAVDPTNGLFHVNSPGQIVGAATFVGMGNVVQSTTTPRPPSQVQPLRRPSPLLRSSVGAQTRRQAILPICQSPWRCPARSLALASPA